MTSAKGQIVTAGVTGASGAILAQKALQLLVADGPRNTCALGGDRGSGRRSEKIEILPNKDVGALIASGSYEADSMLVVPCSMSTLASVANGLSDDLVARATDVMLKEGRKLVLCVRDTPLTRLHLENMLRAQRAGAVIMPFIPVFYDQPRTIDDLVTQYVCRVLSQIGLPQEKMYRWIGKKQSSREAKA